MQERGIEMSGCFDMDVVATSDIETNAIIGYAAIHNRLTEDMVEKYTDYPSREEMVKWLEDHNIGYDPMKNKKYNWQKKINSKKKDIEKAWLACQLSKNVGDISLVESLPACDMLTYSFPCTDISIAGKIRGFSKDSGTRSSLIHEVLRLLEDYKKRNILPQYLLLENVKNLVSKKFLPQFEEIIQYLDDMGYNTYWKVLNGKECGVPQNRERTWAISIRKDADTNKFEFPVPFDNGLRLKDILLKNVPEKYYITNDRAKKLIEDLVMNGKIVPEDTESERESKQQPIDLTFNNPTTVEYSNTITARYDAGICKHRLERSGVAEISVSSDSK